MIRSPLSFSSLQERAKESEEAAANARRYGPEEECTIRTNSSPDAKGASASASASAAASASVRTVRGSIYRKVARWQNLIFFFPWIAPGWRAGGGRKGPNFAAYRSGAIVQKPERLNANDLKIWL